MKVVLKVDIPSLTREQFKSVLLHTPAHGIRLQVHKKKRCQKMFPSFLIFEISKKL